LNEIELNHLRELIDNAREFISSETKFAENFDKT
jgi:hypothetical protein